eukprot:CAMPEP_0173457498 /NCGR_PEP_ID=MMETSP1357-20121228/57868_1 /TAXON_ID=77926 /ORGANISM="Hemiselmis rufescens, Strain PCC563" /LENGTH=49 /DNA_ID= /DNA_START= /DNA_END= /DNA_ORIENTATION=
MPEGQSGRIETGMLSAFRTVKMRKSEVDGDSQPPGCFGTHRRPAKGVAG